MKIEALRKYKPFLLGLMVSWIFLTALYFYLDYQCKINTGCSGEYGIYFVVLAMPWVAFAGVWLGLLINSILVGLAFQLLRMLIQMIRK